jgi:hypothetical protein
MKPVSVLLFLAVIVSGASLGLAGPALASQESPGYCHRVDITEAPVRLVQTQCRLQEVVGTTGIPVHATTFGGSAIVGHLGAGWQQFFRQRAGHWSTVAHRSNNVWAGAHASNGQWGYVNELWFSTAGMGNGGVNCFGYANLAWNGSPPASDICLG